MGLAVSVSNMGPLGLANVVRPKGVTGYLFIMQPMGLTIVRQAHGLDRRHCVLGDAWDRHINVRPLG